MHQAAHCLKTIFIGNALELCSKPKGFCWNLGLQADDLGSVQNAFQKHQAHVILGPIPGMDHEHCILESEWWLENISKYGKFPSEIKRPELQNHGILIAVRKGGWYWRWLKSCTCWYGRESPFFFRVWILYINSLKLTAKAPENGWLEYVGILISFWGSFLPTGAGWKNAGGRSHEDFGRNDGHCIDSNPMRAFFRLMNLYVFHSLKVLNSYDPVDGRKNVMSHSLLSSLL